MKRKRVALVCLISLFSIVLTACGGNRPGPGTGTGMNQSQVNVYQSESLGRNDDIHRFGSPGLHRMQDMRQHNNARLTVNQHVTQAVERIPGVARATVILTGKNAYAGIAFDKSIQQQMIHTQGTNPAHLGSPEAARIKQQVVHTVMSMTDAGRVYVSAKPDFLQTLNKYAADIKQGRPLESLMYNFNSTVQRMFPNGGGEGRIPDEGTK